MEQRIQKAYASAPKTWLWQLLAAFIVACLLAWSGTAVQTSNPTSNGLEVAGNIISGIFHPSAKLLFTLGTNGVPYLLLETFCIAFLGTIVGAVISLPLSFISASNLVPKPLALVGRILIAAIRTVPAFVYGLMFIRVTGPGPFAGLLTMSLCSIGMVSKMFIESIEDLDKRILESLDAAGCTTFQKIRYGILPQLTADFTSTIIYRFDMNLRDATVLGLVGAGGIGAPLIFAMSAYRWNEVGAILRVGDGVATVSGIRHAAYGEIVQFESGVKGMVQDIRREETGIILLGSEKGLLAGGRVVRTERRAGVPVGEAFLGRVVDAMGTPIDGKGEAVPAGYRPIENAAPGIKDRKSVSVPMETGILAIDSMFPIGRGQRELIIGDRQTGKTSIATDTILNQKGKGVICIYVAIGQKASTVAKVVSTLQSHGAMEYSIVVSATASDPASLQYIAPYAGTAMAEYFMHQGKDVLIIYDDLSKHAVAYRSLSLI